MDNEEAIQKEILRCKEEFVQSFGEILDRNFDAKTFEVFDPAVDSIHRNLRPKISLVGFSGVGKTTTTQLIKAEKIPIKHIPTITGDIATIKIGKLHFNLWDFAGQEQFSYLWNNFVKGSDAILLITDSTLENVEKSKFFLELVKDEAPEANTAVIGNKQDLPDAMKIEQIEHILGIKTYSMIAVDSNNRTKMIQIIADILEMSAEVSPLLKPLLERDELIQEAMGALEAGEFSKSLLLFQKISDLCLEMGDDSLGREFYDKSEQIKEIMKERATPKVEEAPPAEPEISEEVEEIKEPEIITPPPTQPVETQTFEEEEVKEPEMPEPPSPPETLETPKLLEQIEEVEKEDVPPPIPVEEEVLDKKAAKRLRKQKAKEAKKARKRKKKFVPVEGPPPEVKSIISKPSFITGTEEPKTTGIPFQDYTPPKTKEPVKEKGPDTTWMPKRLKKFKEKEPPKVVLPEKVSEEKIIAKTTVAKHKKINLEDFKIKQKPKTVTSLPTDTKTKLKTSAYGHVANPEDAKKESAPPKPKTAAPVAPTRLVKPSRPNTTTTLKPEEGKEPPKLKEKPAEIEDMEIPEGANKKELEKIIMELQVKKSKVQETSMDYDMKEISGEITSEELNEQKLKLILIEKKIDKQINKANTRISALG